MIKIILMILLAFTLSGCNANYDIEINDKEIKEKIKIYTTNKNIEKANDKQILDTGEIINDWERGYDFYKRNLYTNEQYTGYEYTYIFDSEEYDAMAQIRKCYKDFEFTNNNNKILLKTSNEFLCAEYYPEIKSITINITSKYNIEESNATKVKDNIHTWIIEKNNYKNNPIILKINKNKKTKKEFNKNNNNAKMIITYIIFITLILIVLTKNIKIDKVKR